jgi:hypothetical protein
MRGALYLRCAVGGCADGGCAVGGYADGGCAALAYAISGAADCHQRSRHRAQRYF